METPKPKEFRPFVVTLDIEHVIEDLEDENDPVDFSELEPAPLLMMASSPEAAAEVAAKHHNEYFYDEHLTRSLIVLDIQHLRVHKYNVTHQGFTIDETSK